MYKRGLNEEGEEEEKEEDNDKEDDYLHCKAKRAIGLMPNFFPSMPLCTKACPPSWLNKGLVHI